MKRAALLVGLAVLLVLGVSALGNATQNRVDRVARDSTSRIVFDVATRRTLRTETEAAQALWAVCSQTITRTVVAGPDPVPAGFAVTVRPALGEHSRRRLQGCLQDTTIDRVLGDVIEITSSG